MSLELLKPDQRWVHNIIAHHLEAHLAGGQPAQLLMIVQGAGGTGKSMLIEQITKTFEVWQAGGMLAKMATMGVAASLI
ncbi:hypothetical protein L208DRAFT_1242737 [Tricholoma matsutake]|nr:hypothetical protein L208DRAFT_1242737 [Tricholoma matsutake 945]